MNFDRKFLNGYLEKHQDDRRIFEETTQVIAQLEKPTSHATKTLELALAVTSLAHAEKIKVLEPSAASRDTSQTLTTRRARKVYAARKIPTLEELKQKFALLESRIKPDSKEHKHQTLVKLWCTIQARENPDLECLAWIHAVPNAARRSPKLAAEMIEEGLESGVPDLFLDEPRGVFHGLRIEMKRQGGRVSDTQELWLKHLRERGYFAVVCVGWLEARDLILWYLEAK